MLTTIDVRRIQHEDDMSTAAAVCASLLPTTWLHFTYVVIGETDN